MGPKGDELRVDFAHMLPRVRAANLRRELLVRAAHVRGCEGTPRAIDATAGLGEDSFLLAASGFAVLMYERNPVVAEALRDGLRRAAEDERLAGIVGRMELVEANSIDVLAALEEPPHVIYLDPMFPARRKSAATKKKLQAIRQLESPCADEEELVRAALAAHPRKVVVKRPLKGPFLGGIKPSGTLAGKVVRYDILVP